MPSKVSHSRSKSKIKNRNKVRPNNISEAKAIPLPSLPDTAVDDSKSPSTQIERHHYASSSSHSGTPGIQTDQNEALHPLPLPAIPHSNRDPGCPHVPARMLNEFVYCPRLAYLEWVQKEWEDSSDTVEGEYVHRRVDKKLGSMPNVEESKEHIKPVRSVDLVSNRLNLVAKVDLVEFDEHGNATPIDYKRGKRPHISNSAYDPERVQLCAQGMLLEENGYTVSGGILYFAGSRERVRINFDEELRALTLNSLQALQKMVVKGRIPSPLVDSTKCNRCSLVGICLPDEVNLLKATGTEVRPISVRHADALPLHVQSYGAKVAKKGERLEITVEDESPVPVRISDISQLVVSGNVYVTTPTLHELMKRQIPITWQSYGGWFLGHTVGTGHANVEVRTAQYQCSFDDSICLRLAKGWIRTKIRNSRILLRRNWTDKNKAAPVLRRLKTLSNDVVKANNISQLLGLEGTAASIYWSVFPQLFKSATDSTSHFIMESRNRRPPTDPVNAMLSLGYSILVRTFLVALSSVGLDPYRGFFHQPRYGRPSLALDMMEPFRSLIVDSSVLMAVNTNEIKLTDFVVTPAGVSMKNSGRKRFIAIVERRLNQEITHPLFGYKVQYRRLLEMQSRLLTRFLLGELPDYPNFETR